MNITGEAYRKAGEVLRHCAKPTGFYASGLPGGYEATWARDSMITSLGAGLLGKKFSVPFKKSILLLTKHQSSLGQIPNAVGSYNTERRSDVTFNSIDSTLWYLIGHKAYADAFGRELLTKCRENIAKAFTWLSYQDPNEDTLIVQQPTMDWQDAFPHKYGRTINTLALYYGALTLYGNRKRAEHIKKVVNGEIEKYLSLYDKKLGYYLPWIWKNHDGDREGERWFDTLGNLLAIVTGLATRPIARSILQYVDHLGINRPYPSKAIFPPIKQGDREWHSYFSKADSRTPHEYLNGGIWPFVGGFYVVALVKVHEYAKAKRELEILAHANHEGMDMEWGFHEWLHGISGKPVGSSTPYQGWSAGMYVYAYECVRQKKVLFFY